MNICVLHRYPLTEIKETNPSFPYFLREVINSGHRLFVITFAGRSDNNQIKDFNFCPINFQFNRTNNVDKWIKSLLFILMTPFKVWRLNLCYKFNIIYCDDSLPFYAYLIKVFSRLPVTMRLGDLQTAYLFYDRGFFGKLIYQFIHCFEKFTWRKIDKIIAISESFKKFLLENGVNQSKISVVEESIDIDEFHKEAKGADIRDKFGLKNEPVIMFHGLISKIKGVDILLKATPYILKEFPDAKIMIVGDGPDLNRLKKLAHLLGISKSVIFTGWIPFNQIPNYISACDVGVPLRNSNLGNNFVVTTAFLQYIVMGKIIVAPDLDSFRENFDEKLLFRRDDYIDLAKKIIYALQYKNELIQKYEPLYTFIKNKFEAKLIAKKLSKNLEL
ncbi:MAG: glycosyltransferase family 4 protein [Candidatus Omnitrophota bacterium]